MKSDPIPGEHHVVRLVGGSKVDGDIVHPDAFKDQKISVNWLECFDGTKEEQLERVRSVVRLKLRPTAMFAELSVSKVRGSCKPLGVVLDVLEDPLPANENYSASPCHAEIVGIPKGASIKRRVYEALADNVGTLHRAPKSANSDTTKCDVRRGRNGQ